MNDKTHAVQRMQDYIERHLSESITLAELARAARFSPWYSARIFKELTGLSPADYIRRLRLAKSTLRLRDEKIRVIDAAAELGFESVDGYQRAFLREFGCNPKEYALHPVPLPLFTAYGVKFRELWKKERNKMENEKSVKAYLFRPSKSPGAKSFLSGASRPRSIGVTVRRWAATCGACSPA